MKIRMLRRHFEYHSLWSVSTAKHFASSLCQRGVQVSLFWFGDH